MASCRYDLEVKNTFPTRGRSWCKWEEDFLLDWLKEFGLHECARQLGRTPSSVALRCAWLGIRKPKKAEVEASAPKAESKPEAKTPEKAPERPQDAKEGVEAGKDKGEAKAGDSGASESENGVSADSGRQVITIELPRAWTPEDDAKLLQMRGEGKTFADCGTVLGRTPHACESRLLRLKKAGPIAGLTPSSRSWSAEEDAVLRENWTKMLVRDIVYLLPGRSLKAVHTRAQTLGLTNAYGLHNRGPKPKSKPEQEQEPESKPKPKPKPKQEPKAKAPQPARKRPTESRPAPVGRMRKCHDCGRPTTDFRCPKCWAKLRANYEYEE